LRRTAPRGLGDPPDVAEGLMSEGQPGERKPPPPAAVFGAFLRLGTTAFGGPAMVPYIGDLATRRKQWISPEEFREGVALCQSIPGATAMQTAAYVGLRAGGVLVAAAAYAGFALPAAVLMLAASLAYGRASGLAVVQATLHGLHAVVVAIVANAAWSFGRANVRSALDGLLAVACVLGLYLGASPVVVIAGAALASIALRSRSTPDRVATNEEGRPRASSGAVLGIAAGGMVALLGLLALAPRLGALAAICLKVDVLAFGGGFASVPLMYREIVTARSWIDARTFMDGIALGQVTPGPIVITATFVGYQVAGLAGALVATLAIFFPSFVIVLVAAPWFATLRARRWFAPALHGALLSFVGLLAYVTLQLGAAVTWSIGTGFLAAASLGALLAGVDVLWVVLGAGGIAAVAL
jgi:chromate transporter